MKYDYREAITKDIISYIRDEITTTNYTDRDQLEEYLNDELWSVDSVTGNASGSYYCSAWEAEEAICYNLDLLRDAFDEFCVDYSEAFKRGAEYCDVTIRCYLLGECIAEALDRMEV